MSNLPAPIISRFRGLALERLERIRTAWDALTQKKASPEAADAMIHELHTVKGDAHMVGFVEVRELCHELEAVFIAARRHTFIVPEEVDLMVTTAIRLLAAQIQRPDGAPSLGLDFAGILGRVEKALGELRPDDDGEDSSGPRTLGAPRASVEAPERISTATREKLAATATSIFLEANLARGPARDRLLATFRQLASAIERPREARLREAITRHEVPTIELAASQGKQIELTIDVDDAPIPDSAAEAIDVALLHALRNAVDHGIEAPDERRAAGKPELGRIYVRGSRRGDRIEIAIEDDGRGIDWAAIRRRAIAKGALSEALANEASDRELLELLFSPLFSTRSEATPFSGRGLGLSAARAAARGAGGDDGDVTIEPRAGGGTVVTIQIPAAPIELDVLCFKAIGADVLMAVPSALALAGKPLAGTPIVDPLEALGYSRADPASQELDETATSIINLARRIKVRLLSGSEPRRATATRFCFTSEEHPAEIVRVGEVFAVLLRPERLRALDE